MIFGPYSVKVIEFKWLMSATKNELFWRTLIRFLNKTNFCDFIISPPNFLLIGPFSWANQRINTKKKKKCN